MGDSAIQSRHPGELWEIQIQIQIHEIRFELPCREQMHRLFAIEP
jgi:hypothetical protein